MIEIKSKDESFVNLLLSLRELLDLDYLFGFGLNGVVVHLFVGRVLAERRLMIVIEVLPDYLALVCHSYRFVLVLHVLLLLIPPPLVDLRLR